MTPRALTAAASLFMVVAGAVPSAMGQATPDCPSSHDHLADILRQSVKASGGPSNGGFDTNEWAAVTRRDGTICAVAFSGAAWADQWLGSRVIAAQKANTANAFSLKATAMSTANLYAAAQPGGFLYGIPSGQPSSADVTLAGDAGQFGTSSDPLVGKRPGGVIVFGGGLPLYDSGDLRGGLGISGDTSCADHNVAWRVRHALGLDKVPAGPGTLKTDGIVYDIGVTGASSSGFGHPKCAGKEADVAAQIGAGSSALLSR